MTYVFQTYSIGEVLTASKLNQGEVNVRDHVHGSSGVVAIPMAAQSDQETATSTTLPVTPGRQQYHPSACKGWAYANGAGTSVLASYNLNGITDNGGADITFNWETDMSSANYCAVGGVQFDRQSQTIPINDKVSAVETTSFAAGTTRLAAARVSDGSRGDPDGWFCAVFGDQ